MWSANQADKETKGMIPPEKQQEQTDPDFLLPRENPLGLRGYDQIVKLTYPDEASAGGCRISAAPPHPSRAVGTTTIPPISGCTA